MKVFYVSSKVREEHVADTEAILGKLFEELEREQPAGVRYAATRLSDGVTFGAFLVLEDGADPLRENPMRTLPAYAELLGNLDKWRVEPPSAEQMTLLGSYRLF